jgi:hypothetical protein
MHFEPHDPTWVIKLAKDQRPDLPWLAEALANCTLSAWRSRRHLYLCFIAEPEMTQLVYSQTIDLVDPKCGDIKLDVCEGNRVIGIEFYNRLFSKWKSRNRRAKKLRKDNHDSTDPPPSATH